MLINKQNIFFIIMAFGFSAFPAHAAAIHQGHDSHSMGHSGHAAMESSDQDHHQGHVMDRSHHGNDHVEDLIDKIPAMESKGHKKSHHEGKKGCDHHMVCPTDHVCGPNDVQCKTSGAFQNTQTCSISGECGGDSKKQASINTHYDYKFVLNSCLFKNFLFSSYFLPPKSEVQSAGFPGGLERPPRFFS